MSMQVRMRFLHCGLKNKPVIFALCLNNYRGYVPYLDLMPHRRPVCTGKFRSSYGTHLLDNYIARRIDGVFVVAIPNKFDVSRLYNLTENGIKVVVSGNTEVDFKRVSSIENDYASGMQMAVAYLHQLGHERIAYLSGLSRKHKFDGKLDGYLNAMQQQRLSCGEELLLEGKAPYSTSVEDGYALANELIASGKDFSAVICTNDLMAMGAISAFEDAGMNVPQDVSVMGFDDILFSRAWRPAISTMAVSKFEFGKKAFELLYTNIKNGYTGYYLSPMELRARESTGVRK